jgi:hypothetical protein
MLLTSATFLMEKRLQKKFHHISKINLFPLFPNTNSIGRKIFNYKEALQDINPLSSSKSL